MPKPIAAVAPATTAGRLLFESLIPEEHRAHLDPAAPIETKAVKSILQHVADTHPERYRELSAGLLRLGNKGALETDSSFGLDDLRAPVDSEAIRAQLRREEDRVFARKDLSPKAKQNELVKLYDTLSRSMPEKVYQAALGNGSNLAKMVASGARGNKQQLNSNVGMDGLVVDAVGNPVPIPIDRSYAEGLTPAQYFGASFGTRQGLVTLKQAVPDAGFLCLVTDQMVRMADWSTKAIQDVQVGEWILGADTSGKTFPVRVTATFRNGKQQSFRYIFRYGKSRSDFLYLEATEAHEVLAKVKRGLNPRSKSIFTPTKLPLAQARSRAFCLVPAQGYEGKAAEGHRWDFLLGYLIGNGGLTGSSTNVSSGDPLVIDYLNETLRQDNFYVYKIERTKEHYEYCVAEIERTDRPGQANEMRRWLADLELLGKHAHEKHVPPVVWSWSQESLGRFLAGMFESDGCVHSSNNTTVPLISLQMSARQAVEEVHSLLTKRFGIYPCGVRQVKIANVVSKTGVKSNYDGWKILISDRQSVERFIRFVPLPGAKGSLLRRLWNNVEPAARKNSDFVYAYQGRESLGEQEVFDLEVDHPDHLYVLANGIIVSNSKQLSAANQDLIVSAHDCGTTRGLPVAADDKDNVGSLLARLTAGHPAGTAITSRMLKDFQAHGVKRLLVRSPITCGQEKGICASCAGIRERATLPPLNDNLGIAASSALGEPLSQGLISSKHHSGLANAGKSSRATGFKAINQLVQIPRVFEGGATAAQHDGVVSKIEPSPTGGYFVHVDDGQPE